MRVLLYSLFTPGKVGGTANTTREFIPVLREGGAEVVLYASTVGWKADEVSRQRDGKVRLFSSFFDFPADLCFGMFYEFLKNVKGFDVIQLDGFYSLPTIVGAYCARISGVPYVVCPRGAVIPDSSNIAGMRSPRLKKVFYELFSRKILLNAARVVCTSDKEKAELSAKLPLARYEVINNGINVEDYCNEVSPGSVKEKLGIPIQTPIVLFLGRIAREKNLEFLIKVWEEVNGLFPEAVLVIAGPDCKGYRARVEARISGIRNPQSILMPGSVTGDDKIALLQNAKALLLSSYSESFGNVVLESLSAGTPVITSVGTPWQMLEKYKLGRWLPLEASLWVDAVVEVLRGDSFCGSAFAEKSRKWVGDRYSWATTAGRYRELYAEIVQ